jgi:hypothetical protein
MDFTVKLNLNLLVFVLDPNILLISGICMWFSLNRFLEGNQLIFFLILARFYFSITGIKYRQRGEGREKEGEIFPAFMQEMEVKTLGINLFNSEFPPSFQ